MNFINKYIISFTLLAVVYSTSFYFGMEYMANNNLHSRLWIISLAYAVALFLSGLLIGRKDIYEGHMGLNYHMATYLVCNVVPILLIATGLLTVFTYSSVLSMSLFWGLFAIPHIILYFVRRKRNIRGFDKKELFD